jgi:DNA primase
MAPEGKEVEELTGKEILQSLRKKIPASEYRGEQRNRGVKRYDYNERKEYSREPQRETTKEVSTEKKEIRKISAKEKEEIKEKIVDLIGSKGAYIFNDKLEIIKKVPITRLGFISLSEEPHVIAIDGTATPRVIEACENLKCHNLIATNFVYSDTDVNLVSL